MKQLTRLVYLLWFAASSGLSPLSAQPGEPALLETTLRSSYDGSQQPIRYWLPPAHLERPRPVLISLHSWSADYRQDRTEWLREAVQRNWIYVQPNFRGINRTPSACGSAAARQDILDARSHALSTWGADPERVYLAGVSGGGHMTMLMAGYYPECFSAASAWVGISDLRDWYAFHTRTGEIGNYAKMIAACCGGAPGTSALVDEEYRSRSPIFFIGRARELPLDLNAGVHDGHTGSVPISHTVRAYNQLAAQNGAGAVSERELQLLLTERQLPEARPEDIPVDPTYTKKVVFRRTSGPARLTLFDGGHEALPAAACHWLEQQVRPTRDPLLNCRNSIVE